MRIRLLSAFFSQEPKKDVGLGRQRFTLMFQLGASALVLIAALAALNGWYILKTYHAALRQSQANTLNLTQALSQQASDTFDLAKESLEELAAHIEAGGMGAAQLPHLHDLFVQKARALRQIDAISLFDEQGLMIATASDTLPQVRDYSDRDYFIYHRTHDDRAMHIGKVIRSRMSHDLIIPISRRLNHLDGSFAGVLLESVKINQFRSFYTKFVISDDATLLMLLDNGTVLYRHPYDEQAIGTNISASPLYKNDLQHNASGMVTSSATTSPDEKLYSYKHLKQFPVIITSGMSLNQSLSDWRRDAISHGIMAMIFTIMIILVCVFLMRQVRARMRIELELLQAQKELRQLNASLEKLARSDGLTGLFNRRHFDLSLKHEFARAMVHQFSLGLILLDIDYFKQFNDLYGHVAGDACLQRVSKALHDLPLRQRDLVARYGGEEFIVLLPETDKEGTLAVAQRIFQQIQQLNIPHQGSPTGILTASIGVFVGQPVVNRDTPSKLIVKADTALYQAKHQGRNQICLA